MVSPPGEALDVNDRCSGSMFTTAVDMVGGSAVKGVGDAGAPTKELCGEVDLLDGENNTDSDMPSESDDNALNASDERSPPPPKAVAGGRVGCGEHSDGKIEEHDITGVPGVARTCTTEEGGKRCRVKRIISGV